MPQSFTTRNRPTPEVATAISLRAAIGILAIQAQLSLSLATTNLSSLPQTGPHPEPGTSESSLNRPQPNDFPSNPNKTNQPEKIFSESIPQPPTPPESLPRPLPLPIDMVSAAP